jgi:hypothetical protein
MADTHLTFDFIKANQFRVIHADGAIGAPTPQGQFTLSFFSERFAIPQQITHEISATGELGPELLEMRTARKAVIREVEVAINMNIDALTNLHRFLGDQLENLRQAHAAKGGPLK